MAQTGYTPIQLYRSTTAGAAPAAGNMAAGEIAINTADGKLYYKDSGGTVKTVAMATTNFSIEESGGKLIIKYGATTIASISSAGVLTTLSDVTSNGTP